MPALISNDPTLLDIANMPENKDAKDIIDLLAAFNPMLQDAVALPCNDGTKHKTTVRTGLPTPFWGRIYKGVPTTKGTRQVVVDTTGFLEAASEVDARLVDTIESAEDKASIRFEEAMGHLEAMSQEAARALIYHDASIEPEKPMGLAPRFSDGTNAENKSQIVKGGGAGSDNTSIWFITWDRKAVHLIYPKSAKVGIERKDRGLEQTADENGHKFYVYREDFTWHIGLTVRDWRYVVRICNIDVSDLTINAATGAHLINLMTEAYYRHYGRRVNMGKTFIYANTTIVKYLDYQARNAQANLMLTFDQSSVNASEVLKFRGIAIRESDAILNTEEAVV